MSNEPDVIRINGLKITNGTSASANSEPKTPFLIGVAGGTASGKSTVCKRIMEHLGQADMDHTQRQVVCISQDSFYRELDTAEKAKADKGLFNFDHPSAFNDVQVLQVLQDVLAGKKVEIPVYDYKNNAQCPDNQMTIYPADVVLFEGILVFYFPAIRDLFHMKLFVDTDSDTRLSRRVMRDISERGRDLEQVLTQYMTFVKPAFEEFCSPTKKFADVIIPRGADNTVAIELIVQHIRDFLNNRGRSIDPEIHPIVCNDDLDDLTVASGENGNDSGSASGCGSGNGSGSGSVPGTPKHAGQRRFSTLSKNIYLQAQNHLYLREFSNRSYFNVLDID